MERQEAENLIPLTLVGPAREPADAEHTEDELKRSERDLRQIADELSRALQHLERAVLVSNGTGFTGRIRELFDELDTLQREAAREFGRKVGDRMGRESLWRVRKGVDVGG